MKIFYSLLFVFTTFFSYSQNVVGLYVNDFKNIIGDSAAETNLLTYAQTNGFNYLILYNLSYIDINIFPVDDINASLPLANFIQNAKNNYGILQVAAVGEKNASFDKIKTYNSFYPSNPEKRFDVFNLEFEFWNTSLTDPTEYYCTTYLQPNGYTCDTAGAFAFYNDQLAQMFSYGQENNILTETYIGYVDQTQADQIAQHTNRVLIHYYRQSDVYNNGNSIFQYHPDRITFLATNNEVVVMPIFSARPNHMKNWLLTPNPLNLPFYTWLNGQNGFYAQSASWVENVSVDGYVWYRYSDLLDIQQQLATSQNVINNQDIWYNTIARKIEFKNFDDKDKVMIYNFLGKKIKYFEVGDANHFTEDFQNICIVQVLTKNGVYSKKIFIH